MKVLGIVFNAIGMALLICHLLGFEMTEVIIGAFFAMAISIVMQIYSQ